MAEGFLARLFALRALAVVVCVALLVASLSSGVWAADVPAEDPEGTGADVQPAAAKPGGLTLHQEKINKALDGWLHVRVDDDGRVTGTLSEALAWRLEIGSRERPEPGGAIFSIRPAEVPLSEQPCAVGEFCPSGYSVAATSRSVILDRLRETKDAMGQTHYRQTVQVALPFDLTWVEFFAGFNAAVAESCRAAFAAELAAGRTLAELRNDHVDPELTFPLKAAVFSGGRTAEADLAVHLRCWGGGSRG
ncbi:MAG: hypothetical protein ACFB13_19835 [Kiloniellaceae bacterium]